MQLGFVIFPWYWVNSKHVYWVFAVSQTWWLVLGYKGTTSDFRLVLEMDKQAGNFNTGDMPCDGVTAERHLSCVRREGRVPGEVVSYWKAKEWEDMGRIVCYLLRFRLRSIKDFKIQWLTQDRYRYLSWNPRDKRLRVMQLFSASASCL